MESACWIQWKLYINVTQLFFETSNLKPETFLVFPKMLRRALETPSSWKRMDETTPGNFMSYRYWMILATSYADFQEKNTTFIINTSIPPASSKHPRLHNSCHYNMFFNSKISIISKFQKWNLDIHGPIFRKPASQHWSQKSLASIVAIFGPSSSLPAGHHRPTEQVSATVRHLAPLMCENFLVMA